MVAASVGVATPPWIEPSTPAISSSAGISRRERSAGLPEWRPAG